MKINKQNFGWIFTSAFLAILLALSLYLGISGWFFKTDISYTTDLELGKTVEMGIKKNQANTIALNIEGSLLAEEKLPQIISIKNLDDNENLYLRAKIYIYSGDGRTLKMNLVETPNWEYDEEDGYYYFTDKLALSDKVALCSHIFIDKDTHLKTYSQYIVSIVVESLDTNQNIENIWGKNHIKNI